MPGKRFRSRRPIDEVRRLAFENGLVWGAAILAWADAVQVNAPKCCDICREPLPVHDGSRPEICSAPCASTWMKDLLERVETGSQHRGHTK